MKFFVILFFLPPFFFFNIIFSKTLNLANLSYVTPLYNVGVTYHSVNPDLTATR